MSTLYFVREMYPIFFETQLIWKISDLDDGTRAWELTKDEFYGQSQCFSPYCLLLPIVFFTADILKGASRKKLTKEDKSNDLLTGPQVVRHDGSLVRDWDLATHGGFLTTQHQDANALNTFIYPHEGSIKLWGLIRVIVDEEDDSREKLVERHAGVRGADNLGQPGSYTEEAVVPLMAGDVL